MLVKCSINSVRGFIKLFLGINPTPYWFHQTLTFSKKITNEIDAKSYLKKLLDSLEKAYPGMAAFFVQGLQKELGIHYHLIFLFWGKQVEPPEKMRETFGRDVFRRWNEINGNSLNRNANRMTLTQKDFRCIEYLLGHHVLPVKNLPRSKSHWHGIRNRNLIKINSSPFTKQQARQTFNDIFPALVNRSLKFEVPAQKQSLSEPFTKHEFKKLKDYIQYDSEKGSCGIDWEGFKKRELKTDRKVSDNAYFEFRNKKGNDILDTEKTKPL